MITCIQILLFLARKKGTARVQLALSHVKHWSVDHALNEFGIFRGKLTVTSREL